MTPSRDINRLIEIMAALRTCPVWERYLRAKAAATATTSCDNRQHLMNT